MKSPAKRREKQKLQFSKLMCLRSWWLMTVSVFVCVGGEFFLQYTSRGSMREIVTIILSLISFVTVFINGGYITQNIFRDTSLNKHGLTIDGDVCKVADCEPEACRTPGDDKTI